MISTNEKLDKLNRNLQRELISLREAGNDVLLMLASTENPSSIYDRLSSPLLDEVDDRLHDIGTRVLRWKPFVIGESISEDEVERINCRLREFFESTKK